MKTINLQDLPDELQDKAIYMHLNTKEYYVIQSGEMAGIMDDEGGIEAFGEQDWEMMEGGFHPEYDVAKVSVTLH